MEELTSKKIFEWIKDTIELKNLFFVFGDIEGVVNPYIMSPISVIKDEITKEFLVGDDRRCTVNIAWFYEINKNANIGGEINLDNIANNLLVVYNALLARIDTKDYPQIENIRSIVLTSAELSSADEYGMKCQFQIIINYYRED